MISIPDFIKEIESDMPDYDMMHNFGKMVVLYWLLGGRSDITISSSHTDGTIFHISTKNKTSAKNINNYINGVSYSAYGHSYLVTSDTEQKMVNVSIQKTKK